MSLDCIFPISPQFLSGWVKNCGHSKTFHGKTCHRLDRSAFFEMTVCSFEGVFFLFEGKIVYFLFLLLFMCELQNKQTQDAERKQLMQLRDILKSALQSECKEVSHFQMIGNYD